MHYEAMWKLSSEILIQWRTQWDDHRSLRSPEWHWTKKVRRNISENRTTRIFAIRKSQKTEYIFAKTDGINVFAQLYNFIFARGSALCQACCLFIFLVVASTSPSFSPLIITRLWINYVSSSEDELTTYTWNLTCIDQGKKKKSNNVYVSINHLSDPHYNCSSRQKPQLMVCIQDDPQQNKVTTNWLFIYCRQEDQELSLHWRYQQSFGEPDWAT